MKRFVTAISIFLISIGLSLGQTNDSSQRQNDNKFSELSITDTIKIQNIPSPKEKTAWFQDTNAPWVLALLISIAGLALNLIISNRQIKSNHKLQLKQIQATLNTNNRQDWITELRNTLAEFATTGKALNISIQTSVDEKEKIKAHHEFAIHFHKLLLLLKQNKPLHIKLTNQIVEFVTLIDKQSGESVKKQKGIKAEFDNNEILEKIGVILNTGRDLLYDEWGRVQSIANEDDKKDNK